MHVHVRNGCQPRMSTLLFVVDDAVLEHANVWTVWMLVYVFADVCKGTEHVVSIDTGTFKCIPTYTGI